MLRAKGILLKIDKIIVFELERPWDLLRSTSSMRSLHYLVDYNYKLYKNIDDQAEIYHFYQKIHFKTEDSLKNPRASPHTIILP